MSFLDVDDRYIALLSEGCNHAASTNGCICDSRLKSALSSRSGWYTKKRYDAPRGKWLRLKALVTFVMVLGIATTLYIMYMAYDSVPHPPFPDVVLPVSPVFFPSLSGSTDAHPNSPLMQRMMSQFNDFTTMYQRGYASQKERNLRFEIFTRNQLFIEMHNSQNLSFTLKMNQFGDLTPEEFRTVYYHGYRPTQNHRKHFLTAQQHTSGFQENGLSLPSFQNDTIPPSFDWRDKGCVTQVKAQEKCGSCWAFSASGAVEGAYCAKHGVLMNLSEQQMVDCGAPEGNHGCNGGEMDGAFQYIMDSGGLCSETDYPYTAHKGRCRDKTCNHVVHVTGFVDVAPKNPEALKAAIVLHGPVSVALEADQLAFQFYHTGVFDASCGKRLDHGVLAVGYGRDEALQKDYWLVKNSWGPSWGEQGFIKLSRSTGGRAGECGILLDASYPLVA